MLKLTLKLLETLNIKRTLLYKLKDESHLETSSSEMNKILKFSSRLNLLPTFMVVKLCECMDVNKHKKVIKLLTSPSSFRTVYNVLKTLLN